MQYYDLKKMRIYVHDCHALRIQKYSIIYFLSNNAKMKITKFITKSQLQKELRLPEQVGTERNFDEQTIEEDTIHVPANQLFFKFSDSPIKID